MTLLDTLALTGTGRVYKGMRLGRVFLRDCFLLEKVETVSIDAISLKKERERWIERCRKTID